MSPNGLAEGYGLHEIADWALTHDGRDTRLFVAVGLRAGASASTGEAWAMAAAGRQRRQGRRRLRSEERLAAGAVCLRRPFDGVGRRLFDGAGSS